MTLYSLPNQLFERACKMSTNQDIFPTQHNTPAFSFAFIQPDLWAGLWDTCFAWEVKFIVKIHARIQGVFLNGSPLNNSRDCFFPKTNWDACQGWIKSSLLGRTLPAQNSTLADSSRDFLTVQTEVGVADMNGTSGLSFLIQSLINKRYAERICLYL